MERDRDLRQRRSIDLTHRVRQSGTWKKRFGPLAAKALTSEISVSSPRPEWASQSQSLLAILGAQDRCGSGSACHPNRGARLMLACMTIPPRDDCLC